MASPTNNNRQFIGGPPSGGSSGSQAPLWVKVLQAGSNASWLSARASDSSCVLSTNFSTGSLVIDGTSDPTWSSTGTVGEIGDGLYYGWGLWAVVTPAELEIVGDLVVRTALYRKNIDSGYELSLGATGASTNHLYTLTFNASNIRWFQESGGGVNQDTNWAVPAGFGDDSVLYVEIRREDHGDGTCTMSCYAALDGASELTQVTTVNSTAGTDNGDGTVTVNSPTNNGSTDLALFNSTQTGTAYVWAQIIDGLPSVETSKSVYADLIA